MIQAEEACKINKSASLNFSREVFSSALRDDEDDLDICKGMGSFGTWMKQNRIGVENVEFYDSPRALYEEKSRSNSLTKRPCRKNSINFSNSKEAEFLVNHEESERGEHSVAALAHSDRKN